MAHAGNSWRSKTYSPHVEKAAVVTTRVMRLGPIPAIMKSFVLMRAAAQAIAFGGVPTGR